MLDLGAALVHSCQGQPGVREGARVDSRPSVQVNLTFGSSSPGFPACQTDPPPGSHPCHTSYHTPPASLPSHTFTTPRLPSHCGGDSKTTNKGRAQAASVHVKFDQLTDTVTSLTQKLTEVTKQNKDMKSQIGDLRKHITVIQD